MERYYLFEGSCYYPEQGWDDFKGSFATEAECIAHVVTYGKAIGWYQVVDSVTEEIIFRFDERDTEEYRRYHARKAQGI